MYIYVYIYMYVYIYVCIYIYAFLHTHIERKREKKASDAGASHCSSYLILLRSLSYLCGLVLSISLACSRSLALALRFLL